jgi:hypothetical protein
MVSMLSGRMPPFDSIDPSSSQSLVRTEVIRINLVEPMILASRTFCEGLNCLFIRSLHDVFRLSGRSLKDQQRFMRLALIMLLSAATLQAQTVSRQDGDSAPDRLQSVAEHAYIYAYPLMLIEATRAGQHV